jgi:dTDP-4-amino-4,6-dideoxygalactose transaminase
VTDRLLMSPPDVGPLEEQYVVSAIRSGWVAPTGPDVTAFENEMAEACDVAHAVAMSSGTAALHLAMLGVGVQPGDVVVVATMTFVASANAVTYTGAEPFFVDVLEEDGNLDPDLLRSAIQQIRAGGRRVAAVMAVDLLGKVADYTAITSVCAELEVPLIEDAAESLGGSHAGGSAGSFGRVAALSFNGNKVMTTSGGGMLVTDDRELADQARFLSTQAREPVPYYEHRQVGYNYRLSNILAALGRAQLARLDEMIARRREIRAAYTEALRSAPGVRIFGAADDAGANCWLSALVIDPAVAHADADQVSKALESANIEARPLWKPMHLQPVFSGIGQLTTGVAEKLFREGVTLPSGSVHGPDRIQRVCDVLAPLLGESR